jgi:hypothetical protein
VPKRITTVLAVVAVALALRVVGEHRVGPFDDAYHIRRIASFPRTIQFDRDREAWCPWPPLYDFAMGGCGVAELRGSAVLRRGTSQRRNVATTVSWIPPIAFAIFAGALAWFFGPVTGLAVALAPYLIGISHVGAIDHHWLEPILVALMIFSCGAGFSFCVEARALARRPAGEAPAATRPAATRPATTPPATTPPAATPLALIMTIALFTQTALIVACGMVFIVLWTRRARASLAFALPALAIVIWRLALPYPDNAWFLGWPHAALMTAAAVALALRPRWYALPLGAAITLPFLPQIIEGISFFRVDPWLASIAEFQPMFRDPAAIGTDFANLGGAALALLFARRRWHTATPFTIVYILLALTSRRFLVVAIVAVILAAAERSWIAIALTLLPPLAYDAWALAHPQPVDNAPFIIAGEIAKLPNGKTLAPWHLGHAIDVFGRHAVVIDNFGSMPDEMRFTTANDALIQLHPDELARYCARNHVKYLALDQPGHVAAAAQCAGMRDYPRTRLAPRTVWARLWRGEAIAGFTRVAPHIWQCSTSTSTSPSRR